VGSVQGIYATLKVLVVGVGHWEGKCERIGLVGLQQKGLWVMGTMKINTKRGIQRNRSQIRVPRRVGGSTKKN
jgi:hypothetical protein